MGGRSRSLLGVPRISILFSGSPADPPLLSMLELFKHNCRFSGRFFAGSHRSISSRLMHHLQAFQIIQLVSFRNLPES